MDVIMGDDVVGRLGEQFENLMQLQKERPLSPDEKVALERIRKGLARAAAGQIIR